MFNNFKILALGTQFGKVYVYDMDVEGPNEIKKMMIVNQKSKKAIRSIALSMNGRELFAANDEGAVFIWKKELLFQ